MALADLPLTALLEAPVVPYEDDEVTRLIVDSHDRDGLRPGGAPHRRRLSRLAPLL